MKKRYNLEFDELTLYKLEQISKYLDIPIDDLIEVSVLDFVRLCDYLFKRSDEVSAKRRDYKLKLMMKNKEESL